MTKIKQMLTPINERFVPWVALTGLILLAFVVLSPFLVPLAWASIICYASWPIAQRIRQWCKGRDTLAAAIATVLVAITIFVPLIWLAWLAKKEISHIYPMLQAFLEAPYQTPELLKSIPWLNNLLDDWLSQQANTANNLGGVSIIIKTWLSTNIQDIANIAGEIGKNLIKLILVIIILFFFYRDGARIIEELRYVLAKFIGQQAHGYLYTTGVTTRGVVYGILLTALVQGFAAGLSYWIAGLPSPVLLGLVTAILALIPFCTPLAWGLAGAWLLAQGNTAEAIGVMIWGAAVVSQLDNFLRPFFISSVTPIPFLLILFGVLGGLLAFGMVGLFIGPIILSVAWAVWREWATNLVMQEFDQHVTEGKPTQTSDDAV
jgi:predicted PurR-regulated permease PerM